MSDESREIPLFIHENKRIIQREPPISNGDNPPVTLEDWTLTRVPEEVYEEYERTRRKYERAIDEAQVAAREANNAVNNLREAAGVDLLISYEVID